MIGTEVYWHKFNVIEGPFGYDAILGSNVLQQFRGKLDLGRGQLKFQSSNSSSGGQAAKQVALYPLKDLKKHKPKQK